MGVKTYPFNIANALSDTVVTSKLLTGYVSGSGAIAATDTILQAIQKLNGNTALLTGAIVYQGTWNATTNTPTLTSGSGTKGYLYKVATAGTTTLDGITQWNIGDSAVFNGTTWNKIDGIANEVISVAGRTGAVVINDSDIQFTDITTGNATSGAHGFLPKLSGTSTNVLHGDGTWSDPVGSSVSYISGSGTATNAGGTSSIAAGNGASAAGINSVSYGRQAAAAFANTVAIGYAAAVSIAGSVSIGSQTSSNGGVCIGFGAGAAGSNAVCVGNGTSSAGDHSIAIGDGTNAVGNNSFVVGLNAKADTPDDIILGRAANSTSNTGNGANVIIGKAATTGGVTGNYANVIIGANSSTGAANVVQAVIVGYGASSIFSSTVAIGDSASVGHVGATVIGAGISSTGNNSIVIGNTTQKLELTSAGVFVIPGNIKTGGVTALAGTTTITTAQLTISGAQGSMTFTNGILTASTPAT